MSWWLEILCGWKCRVDGNLVSVKMLREKCYLNKILCRWKFCLGRNLVWKILSERKSCWQKCYVEKYSSRFCHDVRKSCVGRNIVWMEYYSVGNVARRKYSLNFVTIDENIVWMKILYWWKYCVGENLDRNLSVICFGE